MEICFDCNIDYKLTHCCGSDPETRETKELVLEDGSIVSACPSLNELGLCDNYDERSGMCQDFQCRKWNERDLYEIMQF